MDIKLNGDFSLTIETTLDRQEKVSNFFLDCLCTPYNEVLAKATVMAIRRVTDAEFSDIDARQCLELCDKLRTVDESFTLTALECYLFVVGSPGSSKQQLEKRLSLTNSTTSRVLSYLEEIGLIERQVHPDHYRQTVLFPTELAIDIFDTIK